MQLFWMIASFCGRVTVVAAGLTWISLHWAGGPFLGGFVQEVIAAYTLSFGLLLLDEAILYPRFRSPLRNLPIVPYGYHAKCVLEKPRGKTPLKWAKQNPEADLFNSRGTFGQSVLYPFSTDALKDVLSANAYDFVKPIGLRAYLIQIIGNGLICVEGSVHKDQRKALQPSFNIKHIRALYSTMWEKGGILLDKIDQEIRDVGKVNVGVWASRFALDIIGRGALSREFNALGMKAYHPVAESFSKLLEPERTMLHYLLLTIALPPWLVKKFHVSASRFMAREHAVIKEAAGDMLEAEKARLAEKDSEEDHNILGDIIGNSSLSRTEIIDTIMTIIGAGHETSASSIIWACHLLSLPENHEYQQRLREEVRNSFPTINGVADFAASSAILQPLLESSPYLNGICEEVLRLYPAVPATMRESVRKTSIAGTVIPKGTLVVIMPWAINRNPRYWGDDAEEFRPERWIDKIPGGGLRANKHGGAVSNYCEETFLHGPRACIGRDFAKAELKCALAAIFGRFHVEQLSGNIEKVKVSGQVTIKPMGGLELKMTPIVGW